MTTFTVIVPLTPPARAKSRLAAASGSPADHAALVEAIRLDTLTALHTAAGVRRIVIVAPPGFELPVPDAVLIREPGGPDPLNDAIAFAARCARRWWPGNGVAAVVGDLPALRASSVDAVLDRVGTGQGFVADHEGTGTTMLLAAPGAELTPRFGPGSAARHAQVATPLQADARARTDVDSPADLQAATRLGVGARTRAARADVSAGRSPSDGMMTG